LSTDDGFRSMNSRLVPIEQIATTREESIVQYRIRCFPGEIEKIADIHPMNNRRKRADAKKRISFYLWVGLAFFSLNFFGDLVRFPETVVARLVNNLWVVIYVIAVNFIFFEYTLPSMRLTWQRILLAPLLIFGHLLLYSVGLYVFRNIGIHLHIYTSLRTFTSVEQAIGYGAEYGISSFFFFGIIKHIYDYQRLKTSAQQLQIEKQEAELNYLRSQTNPHFLFNTLNNIYALARDKSTLAPESILRLSKILRFMLYETSGEYIAIEQELKIMDDYIALEKLRYDESLRVNFNHNVEDMKQGLPPLLMIPLVENAFKHGVSETRSQPFVDIHLSVNKRQLVFVVKNSSGAVVAERVKENIGLTNLRRQLELLYTDYSLSVQQGQSEFTATLQINLASHV